MSAGDARTTVVMPFHSRKGHLVININATGLTPAAISELAELTDAAAHWADRHLDLDEEDTNA